MGTRAPAVVGLTLALAASVWAPVAATPGPRPPGLASGSDSLVSSGGCDGGSRWTMSGRSRYLRVVVEAQVQTGQRRTVWTVQLLHNQTTVASRTRKPTGRGVVKVKGRVRNQSGPDVFTFIARNRTTAETCQGTLAF